MGKKRGGKGKGKGSGILHKEAFQRMNYLYQVCHVPIGCALIRGTTVTMQAAHAVLSKTPNQPQLARFYIRSLKTISKRLVLKMYVEY